MQPVRQGFIDFVQNNNVCFLGDMHFPHSPGHMLSELDNFLRMRHLGEISPSRPYFGVFKPTALNLPMHLIQAFPSIFGATTGLQLIEDETLCIQALELQMVLPNHSIDVGLSHFKIQLPHPQERMEARLYEAGGPRSPFWIISQRMFARANMEWYRRRAQSPDFCPWRTLPQLTPELAAFVGADRGPLALLHARTGKRSGADNAGVGPSPNDLYPTIDHLRARGFRVVKFGIEPCPQEWRDRGVIDYSGSPFRSFYNDICLIGAAAIALYNGTGMSTLTDVLGKPMVSFGHWHLPWMPQTPRCVIVPAMMRSRATGRLLRFAEQISFYRQSTELWEPGNAINFPNATHEAVVPTGDDILAAVEEALTLTDEAIPPRSVLQECFHTLEANGYYKYCCSRIGQSFLERHREGLDEGYNDRTIGSIANSAAESDNPPSLVTKLDELLNSGHLLYHNARSADAQNMWNLMARSKAHILKDNGIDGLGLRVLSGRWIQNIGHFLILDAYLKLFRLGLLSGVNHIVLYTNLYPGNRIANRALLGLYAPHLDIRTSDDAQLTDEFRPFLHWLREDFECIRLDSTRVIGTLEAIQLANRLWREARRPPLIDINDEIKEVSQRYLKHHGFTSNDWFVALHVRTAGYNGTAVTIRDCDIETYGGAIDEIRARGGWVIRLGHGCMPPLAPRQGVIDYAANEDKNPSLDLFFSTRCRAFIGCASGLEAIPGIFDVPLLAVNFAPIGERPPFPDTYFVPQRYYDTASNRRLTLAEAIGRHQGVKENPTALLQEGTAVHPLSAEDISLAVRWFLDHAVGGQILTEEEASWQRGYAELQDRLGIVGAGRIVPEFAKDYFFETSNGVPRAEPAKEILP